MRRYIPALVGAVLGLLFAVGWWFVWGCHRCAKNSEPLAVVAFCVAISTVLGHVWGKDHLGPSQQL